jgi:hypothetical protein
MFYPITFRGIVYTTVCTALIVRKQCRVLHGKNMRRNENPHNASLHHQGVANGTLAMEATVEPSASQPATAKAAATRKALAETAIPEVPGALPTTAPLTEVLLALDTLHTGLVILVELAEVRGGRRLAAATQRTLFMAS